MNHRACTNHQASSMKHQASIVTKQTKNEWVNQVTIISEFISNKFSSVTRSWHYCFHGLMQGWESEWPGLGDSFAWKWNINFNCLRSLRWAEKYQIAISCSLEDIVMILIPYSTFWRIYKTDLKKHSAHAFFRHFQCLRFWDFPKSYFWKCFGILLNYFEALDGSRIKSNGFWGHGHFY